MIEPLLSKYAHLCDGSLDELDIYAAIMISHLKPSIEVTVDYHPEKNYDPYIVKTGDV